MTSPSPRLAVGLLDDSLDLGTGLDGRCLVEHVPSGRSALLSAEAGRLLGFVRRHRDLETAAAAVAARVGCSRREADRALDELHDRLADAHLLSDRAACVEGRRRRRVARWLGVVPTTRLIRLRLSPPDAPAPVRSLGARGVAAALALLPALAVAALVVVDLVARRTPGAGARLLGVPHDVPDLRAGVAATWPVLVLLAVALLANALHEAAHALACRAVGVAVQEAGLALWWRLLPLWYVEHRGLARLPDRRDHALVALAGPAAHAVLALVAGALALVVPADTPRTLATASAQVLGMAGLLNLNPVLPTDGYRALEALTGRIGFRGAAIGTVACTLLRVGRQDRRVTAATLLLHWCYVALCLAWGLAIAAGLLHLLTSGASR